METVDKSVEVRLICEWFEDKRKTKFFYSTFLLIHSEKKTVRLKYEQETFQ